MLADGVRAPLQPLADVCAAGMNFIPFRAIVVASYFML